uniref:NADH dehydrogenase [ubiquinone] 1 beta subcomplex subunit 5, mitochondrial n=1 Tax=Globodera pallida TaxID=36090 RepID=A0A183BUN9_GLOPA
MSALSKLGGSTVTRMLVLPGVGLGRTSTVCIVRHGHGHVFRRRQGQLAWNKAKDNWHFYIVGIGVFPCLLILFCTHVYYGNCELTDYPTEGPPPRYWQFERTPLRQFFAWLFGASDIQYVEAYMSLFARLEVKNKWRLFENRVKHLQGERMDYKGYYYHPMTNDWIEVARKRAANSYVYLAHQGLGARSAV